MMDSVTFARLCWALAAPSSLLLLLGLTGLAMSFSRNNRIRERQGRLLLAFVMLTLGLVAVTPLAGEMLGALENRVTRPMRPPDKVDGIIVLGGMFDMQDTVARGTAALNDGAERMTEFITLASAYPEARLLFSGGGAADGESDLREADVARKLLDRLGFDAGRVGYERGSRNTYENAYMTKANINPKPGERWLLVTSAFHMPRALATFQGAGFVVVPWPVDYRAAALKGFGFSLSPRLSALDIAAHEWFGLLAYRLMGYTPTLLPVTPGPG